MIFYKGNSEKRNEIGMALFIIAAELWSVVSVWYGPNMGIFSNGDNIDLKLQNVFTLTFCIGVVVFTFLNMYYNFGITAFWGTLGAMASLATFFITGGTGAAGYFSVILLAIFTSMFSVGIIYSFLYILKYKSRVLVTVFMIAGIASTSLLLANGGELLSGKYFKVTSMLLLIPVAILSFQMKKAVKDFSFKQKPHKIPLPVLSGSLVFVGFIQFLLGIAMIVVQYRAINEQSSYSYFYFGQILAGLFTFIMIIVVSVRILDLFYVFTAVSILGFVIVLASKAGGIGYTDVGVVMIGFCEIGTVIEWLITASICRKYKNIWVLLSFLAVFGVSSIASSFIGSLIINMNALMFYLAAGLIAVIAVAFSIMFIPVIRNIPEDISRDSVQLDSDKPEMNKTNNLKIAEQKEDSTGQQKCDNSRINLLTPREKEVNSLLLQGYTSPQIAAILGIKTYTVKVHIKNIYKKLDIGSRPELFIKYGNNSN